MSVRPPWMTALAVFCVAALCINVPRDLFVESARDVEVWGGIELHGRAAMLSAPLHWLLFAIGAWAFWTARPWAPPAAAVYAFYTGVSHVVWSEASPHGRGWPIGVAQAAVFITIAFILLRAGKRLPRGTVP